MNTTKKKTVKKKDNKNLIIIDAIIGGVKIPKKGFGKLTRSKGDSFVWVRSKLESMSLEDLVEFYRENRGV